ncbi:cilia- and flagella-associated protein 184 [Salminus brasiliensis]|uniref:cilia- and flagella-associated protein 184 n=1 Tax=Salminus brasiliensis TaxID=930266 RepID=UPI003B8307D2
MEEEVSPSADATLVDSTEECQEVVRTEVADPEEPRNPQDAEELVITEAEISTSLEGEEQGQSAAGECLDVDGQEKAEAQPTGEESEEVAHLSDRTAGRELPTSEASEEDKAPDVDCLSREGSVKAENEEKEGEESVVLVPGIPELENQGLEDIGPSEQAEITENQNLQISYEEQLKLLQELQEERDKLTHKNSQLQCKLADYFRRKMGEEPRPELETALSDHQQRYQKNLDIIEDLKQQRLHDSELHQQQEDELRRQSQEKLEQVEREWTALMEMNYELATTALTQKLSKQAAQDQVEQLRQAEQKCEEKLMAVSLEKIKLKMKTRKLEAEQKGKEELAEGLHVVDFEQLKIENQTYNEKIEERNEELLKLRKKITNTVQVLTHVKEKLQFVQVENQTKQAQLGEVDVAVARKRELLTHMKQARDDLRADNLRLFQCCGLLGNTTLLKDFEEKVDVCEVLEKRLETLDRQHAEFTLKSAGVKNKLEQSRPMDD